MTNTNTSAIASIKADIKRELADMKDLVRQSEVAKERSDELLKIGKK